MLSRLVIVIIDIKRANSMNSFREMMVIGRFCRELFWFRFFLLRKYILKSSIHLYRAHTHISRDKSRLLLLYTYWVAIALAVTIYTAKTRDHRSRAERKMRCYTYTWRGASCVRLTVALRGCVATLLCWRFHTQTHTLSAIVKEEFGRMWVIIRQPTTTKTRRLTAARMDHMIKSNGVWLAGYGYNEFTIIFF